jgi:small multidrug resistance family-3 protein
MTNLLAFLVLVVAAVLEISGDVRIGRGFATASVLSVLAGCALLVLYGAVVNGYNWVTKGMNFSKMLGVYIAVFAVVNLVVGWRRASSEVSTSTIVGTILIICGGLIIQFGGSVPALE